MAKKPPPPPPQSPPPKKQPATCGMCGQPLKGHTVNELGECEATRN